MPVITRKIQLNFDCQKEELKKCYDTLFDWQRIVHKAANMIASNMYIQDQVKELFYFTDEVKVKLGNISKDADGILTTSRTNTTYQVLSKNFKGECPMGMLSGLNNVITSTYKKESSDIWKGNKSLRTYRDNIPMPAVAQAITHLKKHEDGNYSFVFYGLNLKTWFGKDLSHNEEIFNRSQNGDYKLCDSSIQLKKVSGKWKIFLLAVFSFEKEKTSVDEKNIAECRLSLAYPIVVIEKKDKFFNIGTAEEFLHRRLAIKGALQRLQAACKYNKGGKGRERKMEAIERFTLLEKKYVESRMHLYSRQLIDYCLKRKIGKIILSNYCEAVEKTHEESEEGKFLLASWGYFGLSEKIKYKAAIHGIVVDIS